MDMATVLAKPTVLNNYPNARTAMADNGEPLSHPSLSTGSHLLTANLTGIALRSNHIGLTKKNATDHPTVPEASTKACQHILLTRLWKIIVK